MKRQTRAILYRITSNQKVQTIFGVLLIVLLFNLPALYWVATK